MAIRVIGAGLGRTGTMSLKLALEHVGFGPCYHMTEVLAHAGKALPQWLAAVGSKPDWDAIFDGYVATVDYPACTFWHQIADRYPEAKVILTVRDPDSWFDSVSRTIFHPRQLTSFAAPPMDIFAKGAVTGDFGDRIGDRDFMTAYFERRNQEIIAALPAERLLVLPVGAGWEPLCTFLGVDVPEEPYPQVNSGDEWQLPPEEAGSLPPSPEHAEAFGRSFIQRMREKAFGNTVGNS